MPLPHHFNFNPTPSRLKLLWRWITNLPNRLRCYVAGHWWRTYDILTDECACCGAKRAMTYKSGERRPR